MSLVLLLAPAFASTMVFDIGGTQVKGETLTLVPAGGAGQVTEIVKFNARVDGGTGKHLGNITLRDAKDRDLGSVAITAGPNSKAVTGKSGTDITGDGVAWTATLPAGTTYVGLGNGQEGARTRTDFVFGTTSYRKSPKDDFVFGTVTYLQRATEFVFGQTVYFRTTKGALLPVTSEVGGLAGDRQIVADFGVDRCIAGVWDSKGLVYRAEVACNDVGSVFDPEGNGDREIPADQHFLTVWSNTYQAYVTQVTWTWSGGDIDISYHMRGNAWMD